MYIYIHIVHDTKQIRKQNSPGELDERKKRNTNHKKDHRAADALP